MKIKEILDKYEVRYGDIIYSKDTDGYYMIVLEPQLYGEPHIVNLQNGCVYVRSCDRNGEETLLKYFDGDDVMLVDRSSITKGFTYMEDSNED